jgi:hypothetical protein
MGKIPTPGQLAARAAFAERSRNRSAAKSSAASSSGKKDHTVLWVVVSASALLLGGLYIYHRGKAQTTQAELPPDDTSGNPTPQSVLLILAEKIYNDIKGINFATEHDLEAYTAMLAMSNYDFTRLYNIWNARYQSKWNETLTEAINSESGNALRWGQVRELMLSRLASLNLK